MIEATEYALRGIALIMLVAFITSLALIKFLEIERRRSAGHTPAAPGSPELPVPPTGGSGESSSRG